MSVIHGSEAKSEMGGAGEDSPESRELISWVRARIRLRGFVPTMWGEDHEAVVLDFLSHPELRKLIAFIAKDRLILAPLGHVVGVAPTQFVWFVRINNDPVTPANIKTVVQWGAVSGGGLDALQRLMNGVFVPRVTTNSSWPDSVKKEFTAQMQRFMARLTETANQAKGKTVLYLPAEVVPLDETAVADKDLVQRLEITVIHWTRQIKDVLNNEDNTHNAETGGPLDEIKFWRSRTVDLSGISEQLNQEGVRRIVHVLRLAKSPFLEKFEQLSDMIRDGSVEANDNLRFLNILQQPCETLAASTPKEIPALLPEILNRIRVIGAVSAKYSSAERLTGLLRKVSNEIIARCCAAISLDDIFDHDVMAAVQVLHESIACGIAWEEAYSRTAQAVNASIAGSTAVPKPRPWDFDGTSIFAQIRAFVERCTNLLEVCEGQIQFARKSGPGGKKTPLPAFGGSRGPEIAKSLYGIEARFESHIDRLRSLKDSILDVQVTRWHDDYNHFSNGMRDLEFMMQNVITVAFDGIGTVEAAVQLLEAFHSLATRPNVKRCVETRAQETYLMFSAQMTELKQYFEATRSNPPLPPDQPRFAGSALWARGLLFRVKADAEYLAVAHYLPRSREAEKAEVQAKNLITVLEEHIRKCHRDWLAELNDLDQAALAARLANPLITRVGIETAAPTTNQAVTQAVVQRTPSGGLECNFNKDLLRLFQEVHYWDKFQGELQIPYVAHDITNQKEKLRVVREHVLLVVHDYNQILEELNPDERRLFSEVIRRLDRRIGPGLSKLTWASKGVIEWFVKECRKHCADAYALVLDFKRNKELILQNCKRIATTLLIDIEKNYVHDDGVFESKQEKRREAVRAILQECHQNICDIMKGLYENFRSDPADVQREWAIFTRDTDKRVEEALRTTVKKSLLELSRAINGDAKNDPQALFRVHVVLENNRVEFKPTMIALTQMVNLVSKELITVIEVVPRLAEVLEAEIEGYRASTRMLKAQIEGKSDDRSPPAPSFYDVVSNDEDILKVLVAIMNGMSASATELQKHLSYWDKYKHLWETDKVNFIRRYAKAGRPLMQFDIDISRYRDAQNDIQKGEDVHHTINFIKIDCTMLKASLIDHCQQWQRLLTGLLNDNARTDLLELHDLMVKNAERLRRRPINLDELSDSLTLLERLQSEQEDIEGRFDPLEARYQTLAKFDVVVTKEETDMLTGLRGEWEEFKTMLTEVSAMLAKCKTSMQKDLQSALEQYNTHVVELRKESLTVLPFSAELTQEAAFTVIEQYRRRLTAVREREAALKPGLAIFKIDTPDPREVQELERDLTNLEAVWGLTRDWQARWDSWKNGTFDQLRVEEMEAVATQFNKDVGRMRDIKKWGVWVALRESVDQFRATMPLILDLKNPALRERHWASLREEINKPIDPTSPEFTLAKLLSLGLHHHAEFIGELSANANKELAIEQALDKIKVTWESVTIDMGTYKDVYFKVRSTEDLFTQLEDDQVALSTMKASRFFNSFATQINYWESKLNLVSEAVDLLLTVQRQWMYLESIFMASEDIRRQLPEESVLFDQVNKSYVSITENMHHVRNAVKACSAPGLVAELTKMDERLQRIQKSLDQYLETKRQRFPRFYFLSNDDLLEILGQSRDPMQVQKHISKCFEGIHRMELIAPGVRGNRTVEAEGMRASDGETVQFVENVIVDGPVEEWLIQIENAMIAALRKVLGGAVAAYKGAKEKWIKDFPGQLLLTSGMIAFSQACTKQLLAIASGTKAAMRQQRKKQTQYLNKLAAIVRKPLDKVSRSKLVALITIELHNRDIMERLIKANAASVNDFEWLSQLRFYWLKEENNCIVKQTNCSLTYSYEYQGNNGRLVVTPLTDRCVLTLTTALHLQRGGAPAGPAGTGKTETVKDLGKNLAKFVVVFNCSDGLDYKSVGRMFSGLVQSGGWGCFDEFNRIEIEVLSVVAQQIMSIMSAIKARKTEFMFMDTLVRCNWNCGIFITMNPGYAGRTELPDNLKSLFRPVAMMVPDLVLIAEVMLQAEGFQSSRILAKKTVTLYGLMIQQLSKQDHYDYGLRSLRGVLVCAGSLKRADPEAPEDLIMLRAIRDMNLPKFIKADAALFRLLLGDLFPGLELPAFAAGALGTAIEAELLKEGLQIVPIIIQKCIELRDSKATRHCNMLVGKTMSGKSTAWRMLASARTTLAKESKDSEYTAVRFQVINPKSITMNELYGAYDLQTMEWTDGILSSVFRNFAKDERPDEKWLVLDGPVDTLWIESMNTVMDDNKTLTLINGDRIAMSPTMSLLFEVQDLAVASPATVSRAGMVYLDVDDLGWAPYVASWINRVWTNPDDRTLFRDLFDKYVPRLCTARRREVSELVKITEFNAVQSLCRLLEMVVVKSNVDRVSEGDAYAAIVEKWFAWACVWSLGATANEAGRRKFDEALRNIEGHFPPMQTVYEYALEPKANEFKPWEDRVSSTWRPPKDIEFAKIIVPTVDTVRNSFLINTLVRAGRHVLCVGNTGTGKSVVIQQQLELLPPESYTTQTMYFSAATDSNATQNIIEGALERRAKDKMGPPAGKRMALFVDDLNMPKKDTFGSQPPLELLRQWVDYGGWYDRQKQMWRYIMDMQLLAAMGPPGGGRSAISERLLSRFHVINFTFPSQSQLRRIFECILAPKFLEFDDEIKPLAGPVVAATVELFHVVEVTFLPTPQKCHYLFNLRDISKVVEGMLRAEKARVDSKDSMLRLWVHECMRVFSDRFTNHEDSAKFRTLLDERLTVGLDSSFIKVMTGLENATAGPVYCDFLTEVAPEASPLYEEATDLDKLKRKLEERLEDYNLEGGFLPMDLVLFRDAIRHLVRVQRVIRLPRGNCMLVGVGGSGRQSLTRLAAYASDMGVFSIKITKQYRSIEFREDLRKLYMKAGGEGKPTVFLFSDTQLKEESFLEDINNILSSGVVPNLFGKDEMPEVLDTMRPIARGKGIPETAADLWKLFVERVRANLHVVLAMSPIGNGFRNRCRMYPSLVNCTTIDWFHEWPADALREVAIKFLEETRLPDESTKGKVASIFASAHLSVAEASARMLLELKRHNYVTPTNYLELVKGYKQLLFEKREEIGEARDKLKNGLAKLDESRLQVEHMSVELAEKKEIVAQKAKDCNTLLVTIVSERRTADEQQKQVEAEGERIGKEEAECKLIADDAESDLSRALPALERAMEEVDKLDKNSISEVKAYTKPPPLVEMVLAAVMVLFNLKTDWATAKKKISEANFLTQIKTFDRDNVPSSTIHKLKKYTTKSDFNPAIVRSASSAGAALCSWVMAIDVYSGVAKEVAPKRAKLKAAMDTLAVKQAALKDAREKLQIILDRVAELKRQHEESVDEKNRLREHADELQAKLTRADKLVSGLSGERERWEGSIARYEEAMGNLVGDCLVAAGFLSYAGPFDTSYRERLTKTWLANVKETAIPFSPEFNFSTFLANPTDVRDWNIQGLPADQFSTENGVMVTRGRRWPLMVDPQGQANKWIKAMEGNKLKVADSKMRDFLRELENAIKFGMPYLLQDVEEELDPALEPILNKAIVKVGNRELIRLGDQEIDYSHDFKLYMTTKLSNPHYTPEVSTKATIVNFAVREQGLEQQLLGIVVQKEEPKLEKQKNELVVSVASDKRRLVELENEILRLLSSAKGSLLDDENLVNTLQASKTTSEAVTESLRVAEETEVKIDSAREGYRSVASRAALLYFVLNDLSQVDPMYQFSLDAYVGLFIQSIEMSRERGAGGGNSAAAVAAAAAAAAAAGGADELTDRINNINAYHMYEVYKYACRGLFERHKLLLSMQICFSKLQREGKIPKIEYEFFLKGGQVLDRSAQRANPCAEWLNELAWDNITELDGLRAFTGIASSFDQAPRDWRRWYMASTPETEPLPGEWDSKCSELEQMIIVRSLRPDRVVFAASRFVANNLGPQYVDPPPFDLKAIVESSTNKTPLIFVLSPGVDPTAQVQALSDQLHIRLDSCALGQGQAPIATEMIRTGLVQGNWVFLQNCHLSISWMPTLEKIIETYCTTGDPNPNFRLWLSSSPHPKFPISVLQRGLKMTTEPPKGLKQNMIRLYNLLTEDEFTRCKEHVKYKRLLFCLCWFHSVLLERRKFKSLGWNIPYDFNNSDFSICEDILNLYLAEYADTPWAAIRYLIAEANYGGRITDDWDRRLANVYVTQYFCEEALTTPRFPMSDLPDYFIPDDGDLSSYKDYVRTWPQADHPAAFGQHPNADIQSAIQDTTDLLNTIVSLQPREVTSGGASIEDRVLAMAAELERSVPGLFDSEHVFTVMEARSDPDPLKTVMYQETDRYNALLSKMKQMLDALQKGIKGLVVITSELEAMFTSLAIGQVPAAWGFGYPSLKPLGSWMRDLVLRIDQLTRWLEDGLPKVFWLSGFTYPTGFLTALLQTSARKNGVAIDSLSWEFPVLNQDENSIQAHAKEGTYIKGIFLEGARWDAEHGYLADPNPMELFCPMPIIHFKPVENKKKAGKGMYVCPLYLYPVRTGTRERPSFMIPVELKSGTVDGEYWTKRGTALLLALAS